MAQLGFSAAELRLVLREVSSKPLYFEAKHSFKRLRVKVNQAMRNLVDVFFKESGIVVLFDHFLQGSTRHV